MERYVLQSYATQGYVWFFCINFIWGHYDAIHGKQLVFLQSKCRDYNATELRTPLQWSMAHMIPFFSPEMYVSLV